MSNVPPHRGEQGQVAPEVDPAPSVPAPQPPEDPETFERAGLLRPAVPGVRPSTPRPTSGVPNQDLAAVFAGLSDSEIRLLRILSDAGVVGHAQAVSDPGDSHCPACGESNSPQRSFCQRCGAELAMPRRRKGWALARSVAALRRPDEPEIDVETLRAVFDALESYPGGAEVRSRLPGAETRDPAPPSTAGAYAGQQDTTAEPDWALASTARPTMELNHDSQPKSIIPGPALAALAAVYVIAVLASVAQLIAGEGNTQLHVASLIVAAVTLPAMAFVAVYQHQPRSSS